MEIQNLYGDFNLELDDFIPDTDPQGQSALPPTEMPDPNVIQTSALQGSGNMQAGLTDIETALLSDEEKMITLRNRGMA